MKKQASWLQTSCSFCLKGKRRGGWAGGSGLEKSTGKHSILASFSEALWSPATLPDDNYDTLHGPQGALSLLLQLWLPAVWSAVASTA